MESGTIDPQEVTYYERLAHQWWDKNGSFWPLHRLNEVRSAFLKDAICRHFGRDPDAESPLGGITVIDIGCGGGILSESMAALGADVHGVDVVEKNIAVASAHSEQMKLPIRYDLANVEDIVNSGYRYDVVLNMEVVEHVADLESFIRSSSQLLAPDGVIYIATINRTFQSWLFAIIGAEYVLRWLPRGTHQWHKFVTPSQLDVLLAREGLTVTARRGVRINPLTRKFTLSDRLAVNYLVAASRLPVKDGPGTTS